LHSMPAFQARARTGVIVMVVGLTERPLHKRSIRKALPWTLMGLCLALLLGHLTYDTFGRAHLRATAGASSSTPERNPGRETTAPAGGRLATVTLTDSKFRAAQIATDRARWDRLPTEVPVVGVIQVNSDRQVDVRPRAPGIVREVHAVLGQNMK